MFLLFVYLLSGSSISLGSYIIVAFSAINMPEVTNKLKPYKLHLKKMIAQKLLRVGILFVDIYYA